MITSIALLKIGTAIARQTDTVLRPKLNLTQSHKPFGRSFRWIALFSHFQTVQTVNLLSTALIYSFGHRIPVVRVHSR